MGSACSSCSVVARSDVENQYLFCKYLLSLTVCAAIYRYIEKTS